LLQHRKDIEREQKSRRANRKNAKQKLSGKSSASECHDEKQRRKRGTESMLEDEASSNAWYHHGQKHDGQRKKRAGCDLKRVSLENNYHDRQQIDETPRQQLTVSKTNYAVVNNNAHHGPKKKDERQRWTELTAVGQMLADEVHLYLNAKDGNENAVQEISAGERRQLTTWSTSVSKQIYGKSSVILENVRLVNDLKKATKKVMLRRDDLMIIRTQTKHIREETDRLRKEIDKAHKDTAAKSGASRFLFALQSLASIPANSEAQI